MHEQGAVNMRGMRRQAVACLRSRWLQPVSNAISRWYGGVATSLLYHRVHAGPPHPSSPPCSGFHPNMNLAVPECRFEEQMRELRSNYHCVALPDAVAALEAGELRRGTVTVTFDDGYRDNLLVALPILERYEIPATICITTGLVDRSAVLWWDELEFILRHSASLQIDWQGERHVFRLHTPRDQASAFRTISQWLKQQAPDAQRRMLAQLRAQTDAVFSYDQDVLTWDEVRELDRHPLITLAAHTVNHPALAAIDAAAVRREMAQSRARLEQELGHPVPYFAYPYGSEAEAAQREFELCAAALFRFAVTTRPAHWHPDHRAHLFALPRIMVEYHDTLEDFRFKLSGLDAFLRQKGRRVVTA